MAALEREPTSLSISAPDSDTYRQRSLNRDDRADSDDIIERVIRRRSTLSREKNFDGTYRSDHMWMGNEVHVGRDMVFNGANPNSRDERSDILT